MKHDLIINLVNEMRVGGIFVIIKTSQDLNYIGINEFKKEYTESLCQNFSYSLVFDEPHTNYHFKVVYIKLKPTILPMFIDIPLSYLEHLPLPTLTHHLMAQLKLANLLGILDVIEYPKEFTKITIKEWQLGTPKHEYSFMFTEKTRNYEYRKLSY